MSKKNIHVSRNQKRKNRVFWGKKNMAICQDVHLRPVFGHSQRTRCFPSCQPQGCFVQESPKPMFAFRVPRQTFGSQKRSLGKKQAVFRQDMSPSFQPAFEPDDIVTHSDGKVNHQTIWTLRRMVLQLSTY